MKKLVMILISLVVLVFMLSACAKEQPQQNTQQYAEQKTSDAEEQKNDWKNMTLTDARTDKSYKISDFKGKTVLLESFAVWCPLCLKQQQIIQQLEQQSSGKIISISLDTDPNEEQEIVKQHAISNNFEWYFSVSPKQMTDALINEFGLSIVHAPSTPVILICADQNTRLLGKGVKSIEKLQEEINKGC